MLKIIAGYLPTKIQKHLKIVRFRRQIKAGRFIPDEPEMQDILRIVRNGDCVIDVGANVGHYTLHMSKCVGRSGRVLAFEPILDTFSILSANIKSANATNVTLLNMAASNKIGYALMSMPQFESGLNNYYRAAICPNGHHKVICMPLDNLTIPRVSLIKIDAEGHDINVLEGSRNLIYRDSPNIIVESTADGEIANWLIAVGYRVTHSKGSANILATPL